MKIRFLSVAFLIVIFTGLFTEMPAQTKKLVFEKKDNSMLVTLPSTNVDSLSIVTTEWFSIPSYDGINFYTDQLSYTKMHTSTKDKPHITTTIEASNDQTNIKIVDTVGVLGDSAETYQDGTLNLNNKKFLYYRFKATGVARNRRDSYIRFDLLFTKPE